MDNIDKEFDEVFEFVKVQEGNMGYENLKSYYKHKYNQFGHYECSFAGADNIWHALELIKEKAEIDGTHIVDINTKRDIDHPGMVGIIAKYEKTNVAQSIMKLHIK